MMNAMYAISTPDITITDNEYLENAARTKIVEMMVELYDKLENRGEAFHQKFDGCEIRFTPEDGAEIFGAIDVLKVTSVRYDDVTLGANFKRMEDFPQTFYEYVMHVFL